MLKEFSVKPKSVVTPRQYVLEKEGTAAGTVRNIEGVRIAEFISGKYGEGFQFCAFGKFSTGYLNSLRW